MDDDIKNRFEGVEELIAHTEKRFDDVKWYLGGAVGVFTVLFSVFTIMLSWNYRSERDSLESYKTHTTADIKEKLGELEVPPELELLGVNGRPLSGQEIPLTVDKDKDGQVVLNFDFTMKNTGNSSTGKMALKLYMNDPLVPQCCRSTDEPDFKYEYYIFPEGIPINDLPGKMSSSFWYSVHITKETPHAGKYKALIKVYYGKGKVAQAPIVLVVP